MVDIAYKCVSFLRSSILISFFPKKSRLRNHEQMPWKTLLFRPKKKNCYVALSRPTVKCEKTGSFFFFFFFFFFLCQIWAKNLLKFVFNGLKKHLYMRFDCIPPEFSPFRNFLKNIGNSTLSWYVKKKYKKNPTDRPNFQILVGWGQHNKFFFWALLQYH